MKTNLLFGRLGAALARAARWYMLLFCVALAAALRAQVPPSTHLPPNLGQQAAYSSFVQGKALKAQKAVKVPHSAYVLVYVAVERTEDRELWSPDVADATHARLLVYDASRQAIDERLSNEINQKLGADKFYDPDFCGGLGSVSLTDFKPGPRGVQIVQFYAPATMRANCAHEVYMAKGKLQVGPLGASPRDDTSLEMQTARERRQLNAQALRLLQEGKTTQAIYIWEELYGYWQNGPYASAGPTDEILNNLGFAYYKQKLYPQAEKILLECERTFPKRAVVCLNLADLYRDTGKRAQALAYYRKFVALGASGKQKTYAQEQIGKLQ